MGVMQNMVAGVGNNRKLEGKRKKKETGEIFACRWNRLFFSFFFLSSSFKQKNASEVMLGTRGHSGWGNVDSPGRFAPEESSPHNNFCRRPPSHLSSP